MDHVTTRIEEMTSVLGAALVSERAGCIVISPKTTNDVAALMRYADANGIAVEIAGACSKRGWGGSVRAEVELDTRGLAGVREHSWHDLTATVGAGTTWAEMQRVLAQHGQQVALDPLWPERATVGGVIATNDSGVLRLKYGSLRDLVIGMTVVLVDGTIAKSGGKVVKNVAGYDLHKLMIGAYGTLAVVMEVTFRLHAIPRNTRVWTLETADAEAIGRVMMKVLDSQLSLQAMQMPASAAGYALDVELACMDEVMRAQLAVLDGLAGRVGAVGGDMFGARERLFGGGGVMVKVTMLASAIAKYSAEVVRLGGEAVTQAVGIMFARFDLPTAEAGIAALEKLVVAEGEGSVAVVRGADGLGALSPGGSAASVMREIKRRFDPKGTLNPGVVIGG
jgi:glycolate oxidase FAD binding subunit